MRVLNFLLIVLGVICGVSAQTGGEMRAWKSADGRSTIDAAFVRISDTDVSSVVLKAKNGRELTVKLDDLCKDDRDYVSAQNQGPRSIAVKFRPRSGYSGVFEEFGTSQAAATGDSVSLQVLDNGKTTTSRWVIDSVECAGSRLSPQDSYRGDPLTSEGQFVLVRFTVFNDSDAPMSVSTPSLIDKKDRAFGQTDKSMLRHFIPPSTNLAYSRRIQPGFKEVFCSVFELPKDAEPSAVEIYPATTTPYYVDRSEAKGKRISIAKSSDSSNDGGEAAAGYGVPQNILINVAKLKQTGQTVRSSYYYDVKARNSTYQIDLRYFDTTIDRAKVTLKVFFTGAVSNGRNVVVDFQEKEVTLLKGRQQTEVVTSKDVVEIRGDYYFYYDPAGNRITSNGAQLNGVIVQVWSDTKMLKSYSNGDPRIKKMEKSQDVLKEMGELKRQN